MKKFVVSAIALAAASVAVPAMAQDYNRGYDRGDRYERDYDDRYDRNQRGQGSWQSISQRKYQLDRRIDRGLQNGALTRREAYRLQTELVGLVRLERSYLRGGLSRAERYDLDRRYDRLAIQVRAERRDNDGRRW